jgi:ribokinase
MREVPGDLLALTDILVLNEVELADLAGTPLLTDDLAVVTAMRRVSVKAGNPNLAMIATLGAQGCFVLHGTFALRVPAERVTPVDTTGAGDCFCGALAAFLVKGLALEEAVRLANRAAALSVTRKGAAASIPRLIEVLKP